MALAQDAEKGEFSRNLTEAAWNRLFWARAYIARLERGAVDSEVNEAWKAYIAASEIWSTRIMVYIDTTDRFYGARKSSELEGEVQADLRKMADSLVELRYAESPSSLVLANAKKGIDAANESLYHFVRGVKQK